MTIQELPSGHPSGKEPLSATALTWDDLHVFANSRFPVWAFDIDQSRVIWANQPALEVWAAESLSELTSRNLGADMSPSVRQRLQQYQVGFLAGAHFDEQWTIFPHGIPRALICRFRGCLLPDNRMAMLCEAQAISPRDSDLLKSTQALLYTAVMVTSYATGGDCTYANPAARRAFSLQDQPWQARFANPALQSVLADEPGPQSEGSYLSGVTTLAGPRMHEVEVRLSYDPIDGQRSFLITEVDVTEQEQAKTQLALLASSDPLTGLRNRSYLANSAPAFMAEAQQNGHVAALLMLDIDRFKFVNDSLGHGAGDALLQVISARMAAILPQTALLTRLGGDEFCCLLSSPDGEKGFCAPLTPSSRKCAAP